MDRKPKSGRRSKVAAPSAEPTFHIQIRAAADKLAALRRRYRFDLGCMPRALSLPDGSLIVQALVDETTLDALRKANIDVEIVFNIDQEVRRLQPFLSTKDRFEGGCKGWPPIGSPL